MYFYSFMLKRYQNAYKQVQCIARFLAMLIPTLSFAIFIRHTSSTVFQALLFVTGWCTWTFAEYILHRFWMHDKNSASAIAQTHHHHHTHPTEMVVKNLHRVAMVIFLAVLVVMADYLNNYFTFLVGFFFGTTGYFFMHQFIHLKLAQKIFRKLVRYHIYHHCKYPNSCFGISVPWWDDLFNTVPPAPKITQRIIDFYFNGYPQAQSYSLVRVATEMNWTNNCHHNCRTCSADLENCNLNS